MLWKGGEEMNISTVDVSGAIAGASAAVIEPRPPLDSPQTRQASDRDSEAILKATQEIVKKMQEQLDSMNVSLQYSTYGDHGEKIAVAVVNKETGELIREIPSKELRALYEKMSELAGMIFNRLA
jgi:flagellar protein FlaG